jgi:ribonuclease Y
VPGDSEKGVTPISTSIVFYLICGFLGSIAGIGVYELVRRRLATAKRAEAEEQAKQVVQQAQREAENVLKEAKLEAKDLVLQAKAELEKDQKAKLLEMSAVEKRLAQREGSLDQKVSVLDKREAEIQKRDQDLGRREHGLEAKEAACVKAEREHREALERVAGMTAEEAKKHLIAEMESQARLDAAGIAKRTLEEARENAEREAREIITRSIQRVVRD